MKKKLFLILLITFLILPFSVNARTIQDYRNDLSKVKAQKQEAETNGAAIQKQINDAKERINAISSQITKTNKDIDTTNNEIKELNNKISIKNGQIKKLIVFKQMSDSENFYLKYIFGAEDFTDFIYRLSVIEQLTSTSKKLIGEMNDLINQNNIKIKSLEVKKKELNQLNLSIQTQIAKLGNQKKDFTELSLSYDDEISGIEKQISYYVKLGCKETQDLGTCTSNIPSDKGFILPSSHGVVTSPFGWRCDPYCGYHEGIDIGGNATGTPALAAAAGKVVYVGVWGGGGNSIIINHNIKGKSYTTMYLHLSSYNVSKGDIVYQGQKIAGIGNTGHSFGTHLHFQVLTGHYYGTDSSSYSYGYSNYLVNPTSVVNFPNGWW